MTVVDVLTQRLENEQESCKRQSELINSLRIELAAYQGTQVTACLCCPSYPPQLRVLCPGLIRRPQPKLVLQQSRFSEYLQKYRSRMLLLSGQFF
jgi:hypothetical protein